MITFSQYLKEDNGETQFEPLTLSWTSSFGEIRQPLTTIDENTYHSSYDWHTDPDHSIETTKSSKGLTSEYNADIHDHPDIKPTKLTPLLRQAISTYTADSEDDSRPSTSRSMNRYLRNRMGDKNQTLPAHLDHTKIEAAVKALSKSFTPENTNRKEVTVYTGVPARIGKELLDSKPGSKRILAGFTSASTNRKTAHDFTKVYRKPTDSQQEHHILQIKLESGTGLSAVHASSFPENEFILKHGNHVTYHGSHKYINSDGSITHVHMITAHKKYKPLSSYGEYN